VTEPRWLDRRIIVALHDVQLVRHGGAGGIRDAGLLESDRKSVV
jgi:death-on-curing protein